MGTDYVRRNRHLVGRSSEIHALVNEFESGKSGQTRFVFIEGEPGSGKSALAEVVRECSRLAHGTFLQGKFDARRSDVPFFALVNALTVYLEREILPDDARTEATREKLTHALGSNAALVLQLIPALSKVIGPKAEDVSGLGLEQRRDRLTKGLLSLLFSFSSENCPLVIILDDLQWADSASRQLILDILRAQSPHGLLLITTIRNDRAIDGRAVRILLEEIRRTRCAVKRFELRHLETKDLELWVKEMLLQEYDFGKDLAAFIFSKTRGNPLFTKQLWQTLIQEGAVRFTGEGWIFDRAIAENMAVTENVLDFIIGRLQALPTETKNILSQASCFGPRFSTSELALLGESDDATLDLALKQSLKLGLLVSTAPFRYHFAHDRISEAAYELLDPEERARYHYRIASAVLRRTPDDGWGEVSFFLAQQFKLGRQHLTTEEQKLLVARINLSAARRASENLSYDSALAHVGDALELLPSQNWIQYGDLLFDLLFTKAGAMAMIGDSADAGRICDELLERTVDPEKRVQVYHLAMTIKLISNDYRAGVEIGLRGLRSLGIKIKTRPNRLDLLLLAWRVRRKMKEIGVSKLRSLPRASTSLKGVLASDTAGLAYFYDKPLFALLTLHACWQALNDGVVDGSWSSLSFYAAMAPTIFGNYRECDEIARIAAEAVHADARVTDSERAYVDFLTSAFVRVWTQPLKDAFHSLEERSDFANRSGDVGAASVFAHYLGWHALFSGATLARTEERIDGLLKDLRQRSSFSLHDSLLPSKLAIEELRGRQVEESDEDLARRLMDYPTPNPLAWYGLNRLWADVTLARTERIAESLELAREFVPAVPFTYGTAIYHTYAVLGLASLYHSAGWIQKAKYRFAMRKSLRFLKHKAALNPVNFEMMYDIASADYDRLRGDGMSAEARLIRAISRAQSSEAIHFEALAEERLAQIKEQSGDIVAADMHGRRAHDLYLKWGASAKASQLAAARAVQASMLQKPLAA